MRVYNVEVSPNVSGSIREVRGIVIAKTDWTILAFLAALDGKLTRPTAMCQCANRPRFPDHLVDLRQSYQAPAKLISD